MTRDLPPELDAAVHDFENRIADRRTRLIRLRATLDADRRPPPAPDPTDDFDFARPVSSSLEAAS